MATRQLPKDGSFTQAVKSFVGVARRGALSPEEVEGLINEIANVIRSDQVAAFTDAVSIVMEMSPPNAAVPPAAKPVDVKPVKWATHKDKKSGKATHYTALWEGLRLRVDRTKPDGKIVFVGFIGDVEILRGKSRVRVRAEVESEALRQWSAKKT